MARQCLRTRTELGSAPPPHHVRLHDGAVPGVAGAGDAGADRILPARGQQPHLGDREAGTEPLDGIHRAGGASDRQYPLRKVSGSDHRIGLGRRQLVGQRLRGDADDGFAHHQLQHAPDRHRRTRPLDFRHLGPAAQGPRQHPRSTPVHRHSGRHERRHERFVDGRHQGVRLQHGPDQRHSQRPEGEAGGARRHTRRTALARRPAARIQRGLRP